MNSKISKSTQDLYLANTLGLTDRAIRSIKKNNPDRYKRELLGSLLLSTGVSFDEMLSSIQSLNLPLVIDNDVKNYVNTSSKAFSLLEDKNNIECLSPASDALSLLESFLVNLYSTHADGDKYLKIDILRYIDNPPILEISSKDIYQGEDTEYEKLTIPLRSIERVNNFPSFGEIVTHIDKCFTKFKKETPAYFPFNVKTIITFSKEEEVLKRIKENKEASLVHYLESVDIIANDIEVRITETMNGVLTRILEIKIPGCQKSFRFDFTEEEFIKYGRDMNSAETIETIEGHLPLMFSCAEITIENQKNILRSLKNLKEISEKLQFYIHQEDEDQMEYMDEVFISYQNNFHTILLDAISPGLASAISTPVDDTGYWIIKERMNDDSFTISKGVKELLDTTIEEEFSIKCAVSRSPRGQKQLLITGENNE